MPTLSSSCPGSRPELRGPEQSAPMWTSDVDLEETASRSGSGRGRFGRIFTGGLVHPVHTQPARQMLAYQTLLSTWGLGQTSPQPLLPWSHGLFPHHLPFLLGTPLTAFSAHSNPVRPHLNLIPPTSTWESRWIRIWGDTIQPSTGNKGKLAWLTLTHQGSVLSDLQPLLSKWASCPQGSPSWPSHALCPNWELLPALRGCTGAGPGTDEGGACRAREKA